MCQKVTKLTTSVMKLSAFLRCAAITAPGINSASAPDLSPDLAQDLTIDPAIEKFVHRSPMHSGPGLKANRYLPADSWHESF
jgi:hypothetical protein